MYERSPAALDGGGGATTLKYYAAFLATSDRQAVTAFAKQLPVPEGLLAEQPVTTVINGLRLACECGNESLWAIVLVTEDGAEALCGQCEAAVQARPDAAVSPIGRTIKMEAAPPRELAPWEVIAKDLANAIKDGTMLPGEDVPTVGDIAQAHGVSVGTAHRAFTQLKNDRLIEVSRGRRAVVRQLREDASDAAWECLRCRLWKISRYSKRAVDSSIRVRNRRRLSNSTWPRAQKDSIIALSTQSPIEPKEGSSPEARARSVKAQGRPHYV